MTKNRGIQDCLGLARQSRIAKALTLRHSHLMWTTVREFEDIRYETTDEGQIAKITINRPEVRNAFRPLTVKELLEAFDLAHEDPKVGVIILTGEGEKAFCSGGDQKVSDQRSAATAASGWSAEAPPSCVAIQP